MSFAAAHTSSTVRLQSARPHLLQSHPDAFVVRGDSWFAICCATSSLPLFFR
jgi:hypothetical protein